MHSSTDFGGIDSLIDAGYRAGKYFGDGVAREVYGKGILRTRTWLKPRNSLSISSRVRENFQASFPNQSEPATRFVHDGVTEFADSILTDKSPAEIAERYRKRGFTLARPVYLEQSSDGGLYCRWGP